MLDPFPFKFAIKFVDGDPSENVFGVAQTGDLTALVIAAILAIIAATAGVLYFVKKRQAVFAAAKTTFGNHVHMREPQTSKSSSFALIAIAIVALVLSLITFVGSGTAQAIAEGQLGVPVIKAQVMDDGTVNINPVHLTNSHDTQVKVQSARFETDAEAYFDEEMRAAHCQITSLDGTVYDGDANGEYFYGDAYGRIAPSEAADFNLHICGLTAEKANSYLNQIGYIVEITFEDAVVPIPEGIEYVYDGKFHQGITPDPDHYTIYKDTAHQDCVVFAQDVKVNEAGEVLPYTSCVKLNPGFVWENGTEDSIDVEWAINKATLKLHTESLSKNYDMQPLVGSEGATVEGLIQEHEVVNTLKNRTIPEYVGLEYTSITHYYEGLDEDEKLIGKENALTVDWDAPLPSGEPMINAKESNYEIVKDFGTLKINQIQFKYQLEDGTLIDGVYAPDQTYGYDADPHGVQPKYCLLEEDETQEASDFWFNPDKSPEPGYESGHKKIRNVADSGSVTYKVTSTIIDAEDQPHPGDYAEAKGVYKLEITPRELDNKELGLLILNGQEQGSGSTILYYRYDYVRGDTEPIIPKFGYDPELPSLRIDIGLTHIPITGDALTAFTFDGDKNATKPGDYYSTLIAKNKSDGGVENNFTGSMQIHYHVYQKTNITYEIVDNDWGLYKNDANDPSNLISKNPVPEHPEKNNPIYAEKDKIVASINPRPTPANPVIIEIEAEFPPETGHTTYTVEATETYTEFSVPCKDGVYATNITVTKKLPSAGHKISLGDSFKQWYKEVDESITIECFIDDEKFDSVDDVIETDADTITFKMGVIVPSDSIVNDEMPSTFLGNNIGPSGKINSNCFETDPVYATQIEGEDYMYVWKVDIDISSAPGDLDLQFTRNWDTEETSLPYVFKIIWDKDPEWNYCLYPIAEKEDGKWGIAGNPCSDFYGGLNIPVFGRAEIEYKNINDVDACCILVYDKSGNLTATYAFWHTVSDTVVASNEYIIDISLNTDKYGESVGMDRLIGSDQYKFEVKKPAASSNDGGQVQGGLQDSGQGRDYYEASDDNNLVFQIVRRFDLFHLFF